MQNEWAKLLFDFYMLLACMAGHPLSCSYECLVWVDEVGFFLS